MTRIGDKFENLRKEGKKALIAYLTAGYPNLQKTKEIIKGLDKAGVDILEIGVPFSDPTADGPIIQAASHEALKNGATLIDIIDMIEDIRRFCEIPVVLFGYYNPILSYGNERFAERAKTAGVDGILVVDLPPEESGELRKYTDRSGIDFISLIAPTTPSERIARISKGASGFLYYISITGVTGTAKPQVSDIRKEMERIRGITALPVVVGFGISTQKQAGEIAPCADGIVIGSAFVQLIKENSERDDLVEIVSDYARKIKEAVQNA